MKKKKVSTVFRVLKDVKIPYFWLIISISSSIVVANSMVKSAVITANILDSHGSLKTATLVEYIILLAITTGLSLLYSYSNNQLSEKINLGVREKVWNKLIRLPLCFYDKETGESLVSRITSDCSNASSYFGALIMLLTSIYGMYIATDSMINFSPYLTVRVLILVPILFVGVALSGLFLFSTISNRQFRKAEMTSYLIERVRNFRLVKTSGMEKQEKEKGFEKFTKYLKADILASLADGLMAMFITFSTVGVIIVTFIFGSTKVATGEMTVGTVVGFYSVAMMASIRISVLINVYGMVVGANGAFKKLVEVLDYSEESEEGIPLDIPDEDIVFENVSFGYNNTTVLKDINIVIPKKKVTAIVGPNGAGKTTLLKLLTRMYEPTSGKMKFGEENALDFSLKSWRKAFALVAQDKPLLSGTIRENITYGCDRHIDDEELQKVAQQACIDKLITSLEKGFDSPVVANGENFSGGQRQCLAIARAIMRNPDYLLLDEATSNLDSESEKMVFTALNNLMENRTTIIIGHLLSAIKDADNFIVLNEGRVEACGSKEEVLEKSEFFREFYYGKVE